MAEYPGAARLILLSLFVLAVSSRREGNLVQPPQLKAYFDEGRALVASGKYLDAAKLYRQGAQRAVQLDRADIAGRLWNNAGSSYLRVFQFSHALDAFLESRSLSAKSGDFTTLAISTANSSSLYLQNNNVEAASALMENSLSHLDRASFDRSSSDRNSEHQYRAGLTLQLATVRMEQRRFRKATQILDQAVESGLAAVAAATKLSDKTELARAWLTVASAHERFGIIWMTEGSWDLAERSFVESFRLRSLFRLPERARSCLHMGVLAQKRGDLEAASRLLNRSVALGQSGPLSSKWKLMIARGRLRAQRGEITGALADFREALVLARRFRADVLPADTTRVLTDMRLDQAYDEFVALAARQSRLWNRPELAREAFQATEENRAASLMSLIRESQGVSEPMPARYGELLARSQAAEILLLSADTPENRQHAELLETALLEIEAQLGYSRSVNTGGLVEHVQTYLPDDCALLSFHLGEVESHLWAVTNRDFRLYFLPGADRIRKNIRAFSEGIQGRSRTLQQTGRELHDVLLGGLDDAFRRKKKWLLALDESLFEVPFCALPVSEAGTRDRYLVERHSLQVIPGSFLLEPRKLRSQEGLSARFLGLGDAIYNTADPRWTREGAPPNLPRLVASGEEVEVSARAWGDADPILLKGALATKQGLEGALLARPAVVHLAAHVVQAEGGRLEMAERWRERLIRLVLSPTGVPGSEYLGPEEIRRWRLDSRLVAIDGCSSGGHAVPGAGLMGLTRPWLAAGARAVVATRWPVADNKGRLWATMYSLLRNRISDPAVALQLAQVDMIRSEGKHAEPAYWAAYFLVGKEWPPVEPGFVVN